MTAAFDALVAAGSGPLEFRLVIEGCPYIFATTEEMAGGTSDDRTVIPGLRRDGLGFSERVIAQEADIEVSIDQVVIDEVGGTWLGKASECFTRIPQRIAPLTLTLTSSAGTMDVPDSSIFTITDYVHLGTEAVYLDATAGATAIDIIRGQWDTTAQEHPVSSGETATETEVYDWPTGWAFRRCWLYAHTESELSSSATGTCVWRGILSREPALSEDDSLSWSLAIEPRTKALDAPIAGGFDEPFKLRGIYYPGTAPLTLNVSRYSGATLSGAATDTERVTLVGFWETQEEFGADLIDALDTATSGWNVVWEFRAWPQTWDLAVTVDSTPRYVAVAGGSDIDGSFSPVLISDPGADIPSSDDTFTLPIDTVSASTTYVCDWGGAGGGAANTQRGVPRAQNGSIRSIGVGTDLEIATYPPTRVYVTALGSLTSGDDVTLSPPMLDERGQPWPGGSPPDGTPPQILRVASVTAATCSFVASEGGVATQPPKILARGAQQPNLTGSARYASGDGNLYDFIEDIKSRAPDVANRGTGPLFTDDDGADWSDAVIEQAAGRPFLEHRVYTFAKSIKAWDVIREELKLYGLIPYLDASAKLAVRPLKIDTTTITYDIGDDETLADETLGSVTGEADGVVTVVSLKLGYDPVEDKHQGGEIRFRGLSAIARVHAERVLAIEPKSRAVGAEPTWRDLREHAANVILIYGERRTQVVRVDVGLSVFGILVGDMVALTNGALPSDGGRTEWGAAGMSGRRGLVLGRKWDMSSGAGQIEVLLHELDVAGYAPTARVTGASGAGTSWTLTCTQTHYSEGDDTSYFAAGQSIILTEWDATTPTSRTGTISGTPTATSISVTLDSAWAGMGGATYYTLRPGRSDAASTTATQLEYCYIGDGGARIPLVSGSSPARIFAP